MVSLQQLVPDFQVTCDGKKIPGNAHHSILSVTVDQALDMADMFQIKLYNEKFLWSDSTLFADGVKVKIDLGYQGDLRTIAEGDVTTLQCAFPRRGTSTLTVLGLDKYHRLRRTRKSRSFLNVKDSDVARQIANEYGLGAAIDDTGVVHPYLFQNNQSDLDFLLERATQTDHVVTIREGVLHYQKPRLSKEKVVRLKWGENLKQFRPAISMARQYTDVEVRAWDTREKREIIGRARVADLQSAMGGLTTGPQFIEKAVGNTQEVVVDIPVASQAEADAIARGRLNASAREFVCGAGMCSGDTRIRPGEIVELEGCGKIFSGRYLITSCQHIATRQGYTTAFSVRRTAFGQEVEPPKAPAAAAPRRQAIGALEQLEEQPKKVLTNARWSSERAREKQVVKMLVEAYGFEEGEAASFKVYHRGPGGKTRFMVEKSGRVASDAASQQFSYTWQEGLELQPADFFFKVRIGALEENSNFLRVRNKSKLDFSLANTDIPLAGALFVAELPDGTTVRGRLDEAGKAELPELSPGKFNVTFPEFEEIQEKS